MKIRSFGLGLLLAALAACTASTDDSSASDPARNDELNESKALGMTDVTILYPTPDKWDFVDDMMGPSSEDAKGELLPADLFAKVADLPAPKMIGPLGTEVDPPQPKLFNNWADRFAYLRIVGIRLDPCFGETSNLNAQNCLSTIRLVGQFLFKPGQNVNQPFFDSSASIHLFYKLTQADFTALAKEMLALRISTGMPLQKGLISPQQSGVHPMLQEQGLRGAYATALKAIILKYAGEKTLARIAFSVQDRVGAGGGYYGNQGNPDTRWVFGGFEYRGNGSLAPMNISSLGDYSGLQTMDSAPSQRGDKPPVVITPAITVSDSILAAFVPTQDQATNQKARDAARKLNNPNNYTAHTADCVSCHMAKEALFQTGQTPTDLDFKSYTFRLDHSFEQLGPFRQFGWDQGRPVISARVVNETANVLEFLNKNVLR